MKSLSHETFFQLFDHLLREADPSQSAHRWSALGLEWTKTRQSAYGPEFSCTTDVVIARLIGRGGWAIMVVREGWWCGDGPDPIRTRQWSHLMSGKKAAALAWFDQRLTFQPAEAGQDFRANP